MHHTRSQGSPRYSASLEPERELHERTQDFTGARSSITYPAILNTNTWQIPSHVMSTITHATQFHSLEDEDAPRHLSRFARICDTFNIMGVSKDAIYLRLFPFSLSCRASTWLDTLPDNSITTWENLQAKFFKKYYPPSRAARLRDQIHSFRMDPDEPYHMAWERFNTLLSRCPQHGLSDWAIVEKFYNGHTFEKQQMFNTAVGGHITDKLEPAKCEEMFESFALAEHQQPYTRTSIPIARAPVSSPRGVHQATPDTSVAVALEAMANEIKELKLSAQRCESAFQDLQRTVGDIAKSLKDRQRGPSSGPNASVMAVSVYWRARFAEIDARMLEVLELNDVSTRSMRTEEKEIPPVVEEEEESVDEEIEMEKPTKKA
ncbi:hypothetical protein L1987_13399 [Smallanthus sonchifolius]|uniref:Uncharacterized protein n=1 Tax=Smallanthus sonchifolius TaxID=185202 RepID=A0ACB9JIS2_9ASTR|nr:hypothetical protein L1987_13399 [Smallanthus sonchifolius]